MSQKRTIYEQAGRVNMAMDGPMMQFFVKNPEAARRIMAPATLEWCLHVAEMLGKFELWVQHCRELGQAIENVVIPNELLQLLGDYQEEI